MPHLEVKVRREALLPCMTCPICHGLFREATTIAECLHTFCRKCIYKKLSDEEVECCPVCNIDLGCVPLEKLRPDHNLQDVRAKIFPYRRIEVKLPEMLIPVAFPAKRKERSLSSLVVSTPRVSVQSGMTGRRSKFTIRKASRGSCFTFEKSIKTDEDSMDDHLESPSSLMISNNLNQSLRQNSAVSEPSHNLNYDKGRENGCLVWEGKADIWKPLTCLVEAANRSKPLKFETHKSVAKSSVKHSCNNEEHSSKVKNKQHMQKSKVRDETYNDCIYPESEKPKNLRKIPQKKAQGFEEFSISHQAVIDAVGAKLDRKNHPIWFSLVAASKQEGGEAVLPQIPASYLRIKDGSIPVSFIHKYLKSKLDLTSEDEVEIKCMGQSIIPSLTLNNVVSMWLQRSTADRVSATIGSSAEDFVMVLGYARKAPENERAK